MLSLTRVMVLMSSLPASLYVVLSTNTVSFGGFVGEDVDCFWLGWLPGMKSTEGVAALILSVRCTSFSRLSALRCAVVVDTVLASSSVMVIEVADALWSSASVTGPINL